jgi:hypothetical protein
VPIKDTVGKGVTLINVVSLQPLLFVNCISLVPSPETDGLKKPLFGFVIPGPDQIPIVSLVKSF